jgi:hypothetical protein
MPASRIISPTALIFVHDDRPAVTTTTASAACREVLTADRRIRE